MSPPLYQLSYIAMNAGASLPAQRQAWLAAEKSDRSKTRAKAASAVFAAGGCRARWGGRMGVGPAIRGGRDGTRTRNNQIDSLGL